MIFLVAIFGVSDDVCVLCLCLLLMWAFHQEFHGILFGFLT